MESNSCRLLVGMSGSMGMMVAPSYLMALGQEFSAIKVIMTYSAAQFIPKQSIGLMVDEVFDTDFDPTNGHHNHIRLARWADLFIILPASANLFANAA